MKKLIFIVFCILLVSCVFGARLDYENYKCGIIDITGKEIITPKADVYFETIWDSFCLTDADGYLYGYCDITGKQIIPIISDAKCYPVNGKIPVVRRDGKLGVYDKSGKLIFPFKYDAVAGARGVLTTFAPLQYNMLLVSKNYDYWGLVDLNGKIILPLEYDIDGDITKDNEMFLKVRKNDKVGYYTLEGKELIPCEYDEIGEFHNRVAFCKKGKKICIKNTKGETLYGPTDKYDEIHPLNSNVYICIKDNNYSLVKDRQEIITDIKFCDIQEINEEIGFAYYISLIDNEKQYVLDKDGNVLFTCSKDYIIKEQYLINDNKDKMIIFGLRGKSEYTEIPVYDKDINTEIFDNLEQFDDAIKENTYDYGAVRNALYPYFIYTEGKDIETYKFFKTEDEANKYALENNLIYKNVQKPISYGVMDETGKIILEPIYKDIIEFNEGYTSVLNQDGKYGLVDTKGNVVFDFKYPSPINYLGNDLFSYNIRHSYEERTSEESFVIKTEHEGYIMDKTGNILLECELASNSHLDDITSPIVVKKNSKYQLYNHNLEPISKEYDFMDYDFYYDYPSNFIYVYGNSVKKNRYIVVCNKK